MLLSRRLPKLIRKLDDLELIISGVSANPVREEIFAVERAIIQIQIEWEQFVRNLILDSATGHFFNSTGRIFSLRYNQIGTREIAAHKLISLYPRQRFEPDWYLPNKAIDAARRLDISNFAGISAELGLTPWPMDDLRHIRNFLAHRSKRSALSVRSAALLGATSAIDVVGTALGFGTGGIRRYEAWINFVKGSASRLTA